MQYELIGWTVLANVAVKFEFTSPMFTPWLNVLEHIATALIEYFTYFILVRKNILRSRDIKCA